MHGLYWGYGNMGGFANGLCGLSGYSWWTRGFMIGLIALGIALVVLLAIHLSKSRNRRTEDSGAMEILSRRYAAGEIDKETFERMRKDLR